MSWKNIGRTRRWVAMAIVSSVIALLLSCLLNIRLSPAWAHNGVVHGDEPQTVQNESQPKGAVSPEGNAEVGDAASSVESVALPVDAAEPMMHHASIGLGEILLGSIVLGPVALLQLRARL